MKINIAIDGPTGVGKSTTAKLLSKSFKILHLNTGLMYRSISFLFLNNDFDINDTNNIIQFNKLKFIFEKDNFQQKVLYNNTDITEKLTDNYISNYTSKIASIKYIRDYLLTIQKKIALDNNIIMDGRDIGTIVLPKANLKIYLTADILSRTYRRYIELKKNSKNIDFEILKKEIESRDLYDKNRNIAPLIKANDAIEIDSTYLTLNEVVTKISDLVKKNFF